MLRAGFLVNISTMIDRLIIKNYAIIEEQEIVFSDGLTIITGETGAGKSILLGALGLIMGRRTDTKMLYEGDRKCIVEGHFHIGKYRLRPFFEEYDIDYDEELVVRREITPSGKSRAFVNDTPVRLNILQQLSGSLIDLHQQFDTLDIHNVSFQLRMIDALANNQGRLQKYQTGFREYQANRRRLEALRAQNDRAAREMDFLQFQLQEFNEAELIPGEQTELEERLRRLTNAEDVKRIMGGTFDQLSDSEHAIIGQLEALGLSINSIAAFHPDLGALTERYQGLLIELRDIAQEFEKIAEETEYDGERIVEVQQRLDLIYKLQTKHNVNTLRELIEVQESLQGQLDAYGDLSSEMEQLEQTIGQQEVDLRATAEVLSKRRQGVIGGFENKVHRMLRQLSMEHARLRVALSPTEALNATGLDEVNFLFAPNKGSDFLPIRRVASGGELSRLTLCTKSLVADAIPLPTLIFDEIDTGISGDVALKMGKILKDLAKRHQVVSITHTPQIAVQANAHYFVYKKVKSNRTVTNVKLLSDAERVEEVAIMLSGSPPSTSAIENAKELLAS